MTKKIKLAKKTFLSFADRLACKYHELCVAVVTLTSPLRDFFTERIFFLGILSQNGGRGLICSYTFCLY